MFHVELNDDGVELVNHLFHVTPVMVYSHWTDYTGIAVWRVNQFSTYSLPGEPSDEKWGDLFADGIFNNSYPDGVVSKLWRRLKASDPAEFEKRHAQSKRGADYDQETMWGRAALLIGGTAKKDEQGEWTIARRPTRKKFLGIF